MRYRKWVIFCVVLVVFLMGILLLDNMTQRDDETITKPVTQNHVAIGSKQKDLTDETFLCPVYEEIPLVRYFYELDSEHEAEALDYFEGVYRQSQGIDYGSEENFDVLASLSGEVKEIKKDPIFGLCVTITCENGIELYYQSLSNVTVEEGQSVSQGQVIAKSGHNVYEAELGNHLHFSVRKNDEFVNPLNLYNQKVEDL